MRWMAAVMVAGAVSTAGTVHADQGTAVSPRKEISGTGVLMLPQGAFGRTVHTPGAGGGVHALFPIGSGTVAAGVDGQLLAYRADDHAKDDLVVSVHGAARLRRRTGSRRPFVEAVAGIKGFSTDTGIGTPSYGIGAGLQYPLRRGRGGPLELELLEIGVRYLKGGAAAVAHGTHVSSTPAILLRVGMALQF